MKIEMTPFTKVDWYGWAGCEPFLNGNEPLIGATKIGATEVTVVADKNCIGFYLDVEVSDGTDFVMIEHNLGRFWSPAVVRAILEGLPEFASFSELRKAVAEEAK